MLFGTLGPFNSDLIRFTSVEIVSGSSVWVVKSSLRCQTSFPFSVSVVSPLSLFRHSLFPVRMFFPRCSIFIVSSCCPFLPLLFLCQAIVTVSIRGPNTEDEGPGLGFVRWLHLVPPFPLPFTVRFGLLFGSLEEFFVLIPARRVFDLYSCP